MANNDADKIAAATLAAKLLGMVTGAPTDGAKIAKAIELYGEVLHQIAHINPLTGKQFTQQELQRLRNSGVV